MEKINIEKQFIFMILLGIHTNKEYQNGVTAEELATNLHYNEKIWYRVGQERNNKDLKNNISAYLSKLNLRDNYLRIGKKGVYYKGKNFDVGLKKLTDEIYTELDLNVIFDLIPEEEMESIYSDKDLFIKKIDEWSYPIEILEKKDCFLTDDQIKELLKLSIDLGVSNEF